MKRYMLFGFDTYYPGGGLHDFKLDFESKEEFFEKFTSDIWDYYQVLDTKNPTKPHYDFKSDSLKEWIAKNVD